MKHSGIVFLDRQRRGCSGGETHLIYGFYLGLQFTLYRLGEIRLFFLMLAVTIFMKYYSVIRKIKLFILLTSTS